LFQLDLSHDQALSCCPPWRGRCRVGFAGADGLSRAAKLVQFQQHALQFDAQPEFVLRQFGQQWQHQFQFGRRFVEWRFVGQ
jgi:hypothetical protein